MRLFNDLGSPDDIVPIASADLASSDYVIRLPSTVPAADSYTGTYATDGSVITWARGIRAKVAGVIKVRVTGQRATPARIGQFDSYGIMLTATTAETKNDAEGKIRILEIAAGETRELMFDKIYKETTATGVEIIF